MMSVRFLLALLLSIIFIGRPAMAQDAFSADCARARAYFAANPPSALFRKNFRGVMRSPAREDGCGRDALRAFSLKPRAGGKGEVVFDVESRTYDVWPTIKGRCAPAAYRPADKGSATISSRLTQASGGVCDVRMTLVIDLSDVRVTLYVTPLSDGVQFAATNDTAALGAIFYVADFVSEAPPLEPSPPIRAHQVFRDCQAFCPAMVGVAPGSFQFGGPGREEQPVRTVSLPAMFAASQTEVTVGQWLACVQDKGCSEDAAVDTVADHLNRPVTNVMRADIDRYLDWLSRKTGKTYRLLSEAEWEYIARDARNGAIRVPDGAFMNGGRGLRPIASFGQSALGFYDLYGNAWEMTADCWRPNHAATLLDGKPNVWVNCPSFVAKGGGYTSMRVAVSPGGRLEVGRNERGPALGFRVARTDE